MILKIENKNILLENKINISFFEEEINKIKKKIKEYKKEENKSSKEKILKVIKSEKNKLAKQIDFQIVISFIKDIVKMKNNENDKSAKKIISQMSKKLGFTPSPLEFSLQSLNKFKNMCEFSRIISNVILTNILLQISQLDIIYYIFSNKDIDKNLIIKSMNKFENDMNSILISLQDKKVVEKTKDLIEKIQENFGSDSSVFLETKEIYDNIVNFYQKRINQNEIFKKYLNNFYEEYSVLKEENEKKALLQKNIENFLSLKNSKEIKVIYQIYSKNTKFFNSFLPNIIEKNNNLSFDKILNEYKYENFESVYQKEKQIFDKIFKKCNEVLGREIGQGKLGKLFDDLEKIKTNLENTKTAQENKKEENQEKSNETQNSQDKQQTDLNKINKPETENKQDKTEETSGNKIESKKIKQGLKILNNNTELKIYQRKN